MKTQLGHSSHYLQQIIGPHDGPDLKSDSSKAEEAPGPTDLTLTTQSSHKY